MADLQISQLPILLEADLASGDELAIVDGSASETKRITAKALVEKGVALIDAGSIPGSALASLGAGTATTAAIADDAITAAKILAGAVGASEIADGSITATEIAANTLTAAQIAPNAIGASELADNAVDTAAIANGAVTNDKITNATIAYAKLNLSDGDIAGAKIANNSITAGQIAANAVGASELADNAVDTNAIANVAITANKIANETITNGKIANATITGAKLVNDTITATQIAANAVGASELADDAVDTNAILDDAVTAAKLAAGSVDTTALGAAAVTGAKIAGTTITAANIVAGTITATELAANSVGASEIQANAVGASELADDSVDTAAIVNGAVTNAKIADSTITAAKLNLSDGDIAGAKLTNNSVTATQIAANAVGASELADASVDTAAIADDAVTGAKIAATTITGAKIAATTIAAGNIVANTLTANEIAPNAIGASELADDAVDTAAIANTAVTGAKIANATITANKLNLSNGDIAGAKIADNSLTAQQIAANAVGASELANDAVDTNALADDAVTGAKIAAATITGANIATGTITATQLAADSVGASEIAANAVGASELADNAVDTAAIANLAVTGAKIANATITANKLSLSAGDIDGTKITNDSITATQIAANAITASELADNAVDTAALASNSVTAAKIAANAVGASELADNAVDTAAVANGAITTAKIADGAITTAKLSGTIEAATLSDGSVVTAKLADDAVTAAKLGAGAVDTTALGATSVTTAKVAAGAITDAKIASGISGAKLTDGTVTAAKLLTSDIDRSLNIAAGKLGINNTISAGTSAGISYNAQGLITAVTALVASDLPVSTATAVGGVSVPTAGGLTVTGAGALSIAATTTGATATKVTFNNFGQITGTSVLAAADLPVATASAVGAVSVPTGGPLTVDSNGAITVANSGVTAGTGTKVTVDVKGRVTNLTTLLASDLPSHSAALITSGTIPTARIANDAITGTKLANASTTLFGSVAQTGFPTSEFTGQFFFDSVSEDLYIYDGNAYQPVTTLTKGNLVLGGTFNANTSQMASVTTAGAAAGLSVGSNLPTPSSSTDGLYVVVELAGTPSAPAPVVALAPPDYILGVTNTSGSTWEEIDLSQTVAGQVASNITFTPYGQLSSTNVQDALEEVETEKLAKAGGTVSGQVLFGHTATLVFEGASADAFETTLGVVDPTTADKTILLPNTSGTLITNNDVGTVTSGMIADATIVNADINASAAIALTKLEGIAAAKIIVGNGSGVAAQVSVTGDISISDSGVVGITANSIVNADISGSAAIAASKIVAASTSGAGVVQLNDTATSTSTSQAATANALKAVKDALDSTTATAVGALATTGGTLTGDLLIDNAKALKFGEADGDGAHFTSLKAQAQTGDIELVLPASAPSAGQVLKASSGSPTTLEWATDVTNTAAGDLTGTTLASNVVASSLTSVGTLTALTVSGTISGDVTGALTGNASTATALATARSIGGVSFDGTADITLPGVNAAGNQSTTGNAATSTKFASAVTIGGVSFDGSANINLPGVNAAGTQDTSGTAALATQFTVTANNATNETVFPLFVDAATGSQGAETDTGFTYNPSTGALTSTSFVGALTGNASTATALATARAINGVNFDGTADITVTAAAGTLSGNTLASGVTASSLTSVGTLTSLDITNNLVVGGNLTVQGTTTTVSSTTVEVADKNIELGKVASPSDSTADGGGITLDAGSDGDKTWNWVNSTDAWTSSEHIDLASGKGLKIAGTTVLDASGYTGNAATATKLATARAINGVNFDGSAAITVTAAAGTLTGATLASGVTASSLTSVGTLTGLTSSGDINLNAQADLRFKDADSSHYVALQSPASVASSFTLTLPSTDAAVSGYVLASDGSGTLSWVDPGSTSSPTFTGDVSLTNDGNLVGFAALNGTYTGNAKTLTVTVASKTGAHRYNGSGSGSGYKIDGKESPFLTLTPGRTYKFDQADNSNSGHPLRFYLEADKTTAYTTGVTTNGTAGSSGAYTQIVVSDTTPQVLHYQCSAHSLMGNSVQTNSNIASTAKTLATARTIGGVSFDGSANINLPGVNASGTQDTSGTAALATEFTVTANNSTDETVYPLFADGATGSQGAETDTGLTYNPSTGLLTSTGFSGSGASLTALNATNLASGTVNVARLGSGASNTKFLRGDNTWQTISATPEGTAILSTGVGSTNYYLRADGDGTSSWQIAPFMPLAGGTFTGDVTFFGGSTNVHIVFDASDDALEFSDNTKATFGTGTDLTISSDGTNGVLQVPDTGGLLIKQGNSTLATFSGASNQIDLHEDVIFIGDSSNGRWDKTANAFVANLTGNVTGNVTGTIQTAAQANITSLGTLTSLAVSGNATVGGNATITGNLVVNGTTTTVSSTTVEVADKNIELGKVASPSDTTADGGGLTLKGSSDKTFNWVNSTDAWTSSEHIQVASGKTFIGDGSTLTALNASNLGSGTVPDARFPATLPAASGANLTALNASNISSGTLSASRLPANTVVSSTIDINSPSSGDVYLFGASYSSYWDKSANAFHFNYGAEAEFGNDAYIRADHNGGSGAEKLVIVGESGGTDITGNVSINGTATATLFSGSGASLTNVNATTLDSIDSGSFLRSDAGDTMSGNLTITSAGQYPLNINGSNDGKILLQGSNSPYIYFREGTSDKAYLQWTTDGNFTIYNNERSIGLTLGQNLVWGSGTVWTSANDGSGSNLDADLLDGVQGSGFLRSDADDTASGNLTLTGDVTIDAGTKQGAYDTALLVRKANNNDWCIIADCQYSSSSDYGIKINADNTTVTAFAVHNGSGNTAYIRGNGQVHGASFHGDGSNLTNLPSSGGATPTVKTSNYTASSGDMVVINGTGLTITLPSGPSAGDSVKIRILGDRYCTVARNSQNIEGNASNFYVDVFDGCATFTYADSTRGWLVGC